MFRKHLIRRPRRFVSLSLLTVGLVATAAIVFAGAGAAGDPSASTAGVSAKAVSAPSLGTPTDINVSSLPQATPTALPSGAKPQAVPLLSKLGTAALAAAKSNADANAPPADTVIASTPTGNTATNTPSPASGSFEGMADSSTICSYFGSGCQPPDHGIASDGSTAVQVVNTSIAMYQISTGALKSGFPKSLQTFFGVPAPSPASCDAAHNNQPFLSDPRVLWDPTTGRWYAAALQLENAFGVATGCTFLSKYWVAVSASSDPTSTWHVYSFNTANLIGSPSAADYTMLGFNGDGIFIAGNQFTQTGSAFNGAWVLGIPKATAEAGGAIASISGFGPFNASDGTATRLLDTVQPTVSYGDGAGGPSGEILINSFNEGITESKVVVWDFSNVLGQQSHGQTITGVILNTLAYSQPPNADNYPSCVDCLETIDNRISATPVYMHGNVYASHDTAVNNGTAVNANVHWMIVHPVLSQTSVAGCSLCSAITGSSAVVQNSYLTYGGTTDDWFGVIQPDREGNVFMAYEYGTTSGHISPSSVFISRRATLSTGASWGGPSASGGVFLRVAANATTNTRWGDYEAVAFEGWSRTPNTILFATEYAHSGGDWGTYISRVRYSSNAQN